MTPASKLLAALALLVTGAAHAATYTNVPAGANTGLPFASFGNSPNPSGDSPMVGEVFSLASSETLSSFSFYAVGNQSLPLTLNIAQWNPGTNAQNQAVNIVGSTLLASTSAVESFNAASGVTTLEFDSLGFNATAGTKYVAYLTSSDPSVTGIQLSRTQTTQDASGFGIGNAYLSTIPGQGWQLPFNGSGFLSLQYTAVVAAVPEPDAAAMVLAGFGVLGFVARRRKAARA
jgi:hypothetical protein